MFKRLIWAPHAALVTAVAFLLASCQGLTNPREASYAGECFKTGALGAGLGLAADVLMNMNDYKSGTMSKGMGKRLGTKMVIGAAAGCAVGLATTAVGKALDARERQKQDEAFQQAAQSAAAQVEQERQQIATRYRDMPPPATEAERAKREEEKARDLASVGSRNLPARSWSEGETKGKVIVVGISSSVQTTGSSGSAEDCLELEETVTKDGREVKQRSTSCRNSETGGYERVKVEVA
jgi:hypothetical protein